MFQPEKKEKILASIKLNIIRHGEKDGPNNVTQAEDQTMRLTNKGRSQAHEKGLVLGTTGGVASGSPRQRTQETALHSAHANNPAVIGDESLEELMEKTGHKTWVNSNLDMPFDKDHPDFEELNSHYTQGRMLRRYVEMDQELIQSGGDRSQSIYGVQARNIASLIERFARITEKLGERNQRGEELGEELTKEREHNMATHGSVMESFLVEVIRRTLGEREKERLLDIIPNGVAVSEGITITMEALENKKTNIHLAFSIEKEEQSYQYNYTVPLVVIQDIIRDFSSKETKIDLT
jgi:hypothetical protein